MARESVESLCQQAQHAVSQRDNETARQLYLQALSLKADSADVHYGLATVYFLLSDLHAAAHHFQEVIRLDHTRAAAHINLGAVFNRMDKLDDAIPVLRKGIQLDLSRSEGYYNLGVVYKRKGQPDLAIQAYREAVRVNPRMADAHFNLGNLYFEKEQFGQALAHYKQSVELRPTWEKALSGLEQCEARVAAVHSKATGNPPVATGAAPKAVSGIDAKFDPERAIDPEIHGGMLTPLHRATVEVDDLGRNFLAVLEKEIEPAIKELSTCLLYPDSSAHQLALCLEKFELALANMRSVQQNLQTSMQRVHKLGDYLLRH
jgi:tetratricopeptide (TPR) repeat protein